MNRQVRTRVLSRYIWRFSQKSADDGASSLSVETGAYFKLIHREYAKISSLATNRAPHADLILRLELRLLRVARGSTQQVAFQEISEDSREIPRDCVGAITESVSELKGLINNGPPWQLSTDLVAKFPVYPFPDRLLDTVSTVETG